MRFVKEILKPARILATGLDGSTRVERVLTADRLRKIAETGNKMLESGLKIYAPWKHGFKDKDGPLGPDKKREPDSRDNAGMWEKLWFDEENQTLMAELNSENEEDAKKIGTTVKEVSPMLKTFTDGEGHVWEDAPYHIALVTHPILSGQSNFQPSEMAASLCAEEGFAFSMSDIQELLLTEIQLKAQNAERQKNEEIAMAEGEVKVEIKEEKKETVASATVADALKALKKLKIELPDDTTSDNFIERLVVAVNAIEKATAKENEDKPPVEQPMPVAMSLEGESPVATKNTEAPNPLQAFAEKQARCGYVDRIENLVKTGRTTPAYALKHLKPLVEGFALSLGDDGEPQRGMLDELLGALEEVPENTILNVSGSGKTGKDKKGVAFSFEEPLPDGYEGDPNRPDDAKEIEEADKQVARMEGRPVKTAV